MIPVLAVTSPALACQQLADHFGFQPRGMGRMVFGTAEIVVVPQGKISQGKISQGEIPQGFIDLPLDHVAFQVPDAEEQYLLSRAVGAQLDPNFTPNGLRDIPEFWENGVRFVFFQGPDATPLEFCTKNPPSAPQPNGHSHYAIRTQDIDATESRIIAMGGHRMAQHRLAGNPTPVTVRFMALGAVVFELFDEAPIAQTKPSLGWIGLLPA